MIEKLYTEETPSYDTTDFAKESDSSPSPTMSNSSSTKIAKIKQLKQSKNEDQSTENCLKVNKKNDYSLIDPSTKHQIIKQIHDSMDHLKNELLQKGMKNYADDVDSMTKGLEASRKKQEEMDRIKREQELIRIEKERIEKEKEKLRYEAEQLRIERELILMAAAASSTTTKSLSSSSTSSASSTNEHLDLGYNNMNDIQDYDLFKKSASNANTVDLIDQFGNKLTFQQTNPNESLLPPLIKEAERQLLAHQLNQQKLLSSVNLNKIDQCMRRSVPNLLNDLDNVNNTNNFNLVLDDSNYMNKQINPNLMNPIVNYVTQPQQMSRSLYQPQNKQQIKSQQQQQHQQPFTKLRNTNFLPKSHNSSSSNLFTSAKPPHPNSHQRFISSSQSDLKNGLKYHHQPQQTSQKFNQFQMNPYLIQQQPQQPPALPLQPPLMKPSQPPPVPPTISLNQKCSHCSQILGQGSAMFIEKLGLAFHLKCFKCSVCNIPLGNGKEGTDVRVSGLNRLHCNDCFSNDLGKIIYLF